MSQKKSNKLKAPAKVNIKNRRAEHDYFVVDRLTAGLVLTGTEIKSIRAGKAGLVDTFCFIRDGEMWVKNMYVAEYAFGSFNRHELRRDRKLLLNKREIRRWESDTRTPGLTIVPLRLFLDENGRAKLDVGLCRGKHEYDKRETLKEKEGRREIERITKGHKY
ncbi:MAG: SsrA-binding protein SmpB [Alloprevotella sp.]|nr:SsrA-binding protein SmpB [Alloprevotella sp.]